MHDEMIEEHQPRKREAGKTCLNLKEIRDCSSRAAIGKNSRDARDSACQALSLASLTFATLSGTLPHKVPILLATVSAR